MLPFSVLANASMAFALSAHTPRVQLSVFIVSTCWRSEQGEDMPGSYLATAGTPVNSIEHHVFNVFNVPNVFMC